ncbi:hypothetical protein BDW68DRAFT_65011 [Aspergillus falconensis]
MSYQLGQSSPEQGHNIYFSESRAKHKQVPALTVITDIFGLFQEDCIASGLSDRFYRGGSGQEDRLCRSWRLTCDWCAIMIQHSSGVAFMVLDALWGTLGAVEMLILCIMVAIIYGSYSL